MNNKLIYLLPLIWFVINILQGFYTEISNDEAYYWMYAQKMDWGYFDHPPMIALMIKTGYQIIPNVLGVRLVTILFSSLTLYVLFLINNKKNPLQLFLIFVAISITQAYSFIAVPDSPLLFFASLFFYFLQKYLQRDNLINSVGLGVVIALLLYSKYHGILIVFFTIISFPQLFKKKSFYWIILVSLVVYFPHIYWQIINDYPSYKFHVLSKSHDPYHPTDSLLYLLGQLVVFGPLVGFIFFSYLYRSKPKDQFEKTLRFIILGFILFFLLSTLNSHGELNWTGVAVIPGIISFHRWLMDKPNRFFKPLAYISIALFFVARIHLMHSLIPQVKNRKSEFHNGKLWAQTIKEKAAGLPVVFKNSYQDASKYAFYSGQQSHSLNNSRYRRNQYDMWDIEDSLQGQKVMVIHNWFDNKHDSLITIRGKRSISFDENFLSYTKIKAEIVLKKIQSKENEIINIDITLSNDYPQAIDFSKNGGKVDLHYEILKNGKFLYSTKIRSLKDIVLKNETVFPVSIKAPKENGKYYLKFTINTKDYGPFINSRFIPFIVE